MNLPLIAASLVGTPSAGPGVFTTVALAVIDVFSDVYGELFRHCAKTMKRHNKGKPHIGASAAGHIRPQAEQRS
jgi:hypothetical protein